MRAVLQQPERQTLPVADQIVLLHCALQGLFDETSASDLDTATAVIREEAVPILDGARERIAGGKPLEATDLADILTTCRHVLDSRGLGGTADANA